MKTKSLEEIKDEYAKVRGYKDWADFVWSIRHSFSDKQQAITLFTIANNTVAHRYAKEQQKELLEALEEMIAFDEEGVGAPDCIIEKAKSAIEKHRNNE